MTKKDNWDKIKIVFTILTPIAIIFSGYFINVTLQENEIKVKYVEIAVRILSSKPTEETSALRNWAIDLLNENSNVKLDSLAIDELLKTPIYLIDDAGNFLTDSEGNRLWGN
ncbi:MAG: hypothetical protein DRH89_10730 [Candidatus Cloacimonadota bacterium]|nr:MAG: hypothetical protein DRH89_10730 [Candidatus Cloacimonadota bacterium]